MWSWFTSSLNRKFAAILAVALLSASALSLVIFIGLYRAELEEERSQASLQVNRLLQSALENAMLKRDLEGLRSIVDGLGRQEGISQAMIVNPGGEVRFASDSGRLGRLVDVSTGEECVGCDLDEGTWADSTIFAVNEQGHEVLRSVNPVHNKPACAGCHGDEESNPINGILFVDYDAGAIRDRARSTAVVLAGSGSLVVCLVLAGTWLFLRQQVLTPVQSIAGVSRSLADGRLEDRVRPKGRDELAQLGRAFDDMADSLEANIRVIESKEAFLQSVLDAIPDGVRVIDEDYRIVKVNRAYCDQLDVSPDESVGLPCFRSSHRRREPCVPTLVTCPLHEIRKSDQPVKSIHRHIRRDGSAIEVEVLAVPAETQAEGAKRRLIVESIRDLAQHLDVSHEQRLAEMARLATGVAHEIHNPLTSIRLALHGAFRKRKAQELSDEAFDSYLTKIDRQIDKCIEITERLLRLSIPPDERPQLVSVNPAISDTVSLMTHEAERLSIDLELSLDPADPRVIARDSEVRMLVLNFMQNAFHAMPEGGALTVSSAIQDETVRLSFTDTGVGIPPEVLPRVFQPFFSRRADGKPGTGLGLTISKAIVDRYGGQIDIRTRVDEGTAFQIELPGAVGQG
ncbi:MAG: ATP-binding protein [Kiloniellales bacterium]|nr:ATP-binding protein [Kiloniellales bacterium]